MIILPQKLLKCVYKDVVDYFACFVENKTNFESFSVGQNLVIFQKKHKKTQIFATFFLTPPFFGRKQTNCQKKSHRPSQMTKMLTKKILVTLEQKLTEKIHNLEPPIDPYRGGGDFEINS